MPESALVEEMQPRMIRDARQDSRLLHVSNLRHRRSSTDLFGRALQFSLLTRVLPRRSESPSASACSVPQVPRRRMASPSPTWIPRSSRATTSISMPTAPGSIGHRFPPDRSSISVFSLPRRFQPQADRRHHRRCGKVQCARGHPNARKIADLYNAFMDESAIEAKGLDPLKPHLAEIAAIQDRRQLSLALGKTLRADVDMLNNAVFQHLESLRPVGRARLQRLRPLHALSAAGRP